MGDDFAEWDSFMEVYEWSTTPAQALLMYKQRRRWHRRWDEFFALQRDERRDAAMEKDSDIPTDKEN